jgi:8-oxo-dGTP pyrophosphatase MutT (NUDIX family)
LCLCVFVAIPRLNCPSMYISGEIILELEKKYGKPEELSLEYEMSEREFEIVRGSQKHGRAHDVTLFIIKDGCIVVIKKPMYPPGAYRAPSGGVAPGEPFEEGAIREAHEETGFVVSLEKYILRVRVRFSNGAETIDWTSHILTASPIAGELEPIDTHEIAEARLATVAELMGGIRDALLASGSTGLRYRSDLNDAVMRRLIEAGL